MFPCMGRAPLQYYTRKIQSMENPNPQELEERSLTDRDILDISRTVSYDHLGDLGFQLGFSLVEVQNWKKQYRDDTAEIVQLMLDKWRMKKPASESTVQAVRQMLRKNLSVEVLRGKESHKSITPKLSVEKCKARLVDYYKKTCKIALKPWDKTNCADCNDLHTRISLLVAERGARGGDDVKKVPLPGSINDIFKTKVDGSLPSRILMIGGAGHGKTTAMTKLAYDWATEAEDSPLKEVPLVFALKFRRSDKRTSLGEAIVRQLLGRIEGITAEEMEKFIDENEDDCVVLLDGYDEYSGSITSEGPKSSQEELLLYERFQKCRVLVTCRPHRKEDFEMDELSLVYAKMEIEGFAPDDSDNYIDRFFGSKEADARDLKTYLQSQASIGSLVNIPFFCMAFCVLWEGGFLQDTKSLTALFNRLMKYLLGHARSKTSLSSKSLVGKPKKGFIKSVVSRIGKVALKSLLNDSKKLLFEEEDFSNCTEELNISVEIGLLSKQTVVEETSEWDEAETVFVEFYHKLAQEHCAGFYLSTLDRDELHQILEGITSESRALELENVLKFASGSSDNVCLTILKRFESITWSAPPPYRHAIGQRSERHRLVFDLVCESTEKLSGEHLTSTILPYFKDGEFHFVETSSSATIYGFARLPLEVKAQIKTMVIAFCELTNHQVHLLWKSLALCSALHRLELRGSTLPINGRLDTLRFVRQLDTMAITTNHRLLLASLPSVEEIRNSSDERRRSDAFMREIADGILETNGKQTDVVLTLPQGFTIFRRSTCVSTETVNFFLERTLPHMVSPTALVLEVPMHYDDVINIIRECIRRPTIFKMRFSIDVANPLCSGRDDAADHPEVDLAPHGVHVVERRSWKLESEWKDHYNDLSPDSSSGGFWAFITAYSVHDESVEHMMFTLQRPEYRFRKRRSTMVRRVL